MELLLGYSLPPQQLTLPPLDLSPQEQLQLPQELQPLLPLELQLQSLLILSLLEVNQLPLLEDSPPALFKLHLNSAPLKLSNLPMELDISVPMEDLNITFVSPAAIPKVSSNHAPVEHPANAPTESNAVTEDSLHHAPSKSPDYFTQF